MPIHLNNNLAEFIGALLVHVVGTLLGTAALTTAATAIVVVSTLHGLGLSLAVGSDRDVADVEAMLERGLVTRSALRDAFAAMRPGLVRYPAIDADALAGRIERFLDERPDA